MEQNWGIIGHQNIINFLEKSIKQNRLANTYLFYGIKGLGKKTVAEKFAQKIINQQQGQTMELYPLEPEEGKKEIGIEQVREWRRSLSLKSFSDQYKVGLIYEAENLNESSANALLKTIEEPTPQTVIIMVTSDWSKLLDTIISRSQIIKFLTVSSKIIIKSLADKISDKGNLDKIVSLSNGCPGEAVKLLEDSAYQESFFIKHKLVNNLFNQDINSRFLSIAGLIDSIKDLYAKRIEAEKFLDHFDFIIQNIIHTKYNLAYSDVKELNSNINISFKKIIKLLNLSTRARNDINSNVQPKLALENLIINI